VPATFETSRIRFQYPDNWTLEEQEVRGDDRAVTVTSPGGAFWSVAAHPAGVPPRPLADEALRAMQQEYQEVEYEPVSESVAGCEMVGYDLNFYYLDLTSTARVRCFRRVDAVYAVFYQAEDRDFDRLDLVFQAITASLAGR